jgi:outer membrane receptor protein involved in Fe transport
VLFDWSLFERQARTIFADKSKYARKEAGVRRPTEIAVAVVLIGGLLFCSPAWSGTTGKIAGTVTDQATGQSLPGANVVVVGTTLGASTDINGHYTILYVPPGTYQLQVSYIGYATITMNDVRIYIDQTARIDVALKEELIELGEATIIAERPIIKPDVATSVAAVAAEEIQELPVSSIESVVGLQAGIEGGLQIRGGGADEALFLMDGVTLRDPRNNNPVSSIALSAVKEINVERGGFNAEYGQVRSGIVNVVTREGNRSDYQGRIEFKYSPPKPKHFGISPFDKNSFWLRPYFDDAVAWTGTASGAWDKYTQRQYPDFEGWNAVSRELMANNNPNDDLSPLAAQRVFEWETRKQPRWNQPDYNIDAGFGGPMPLIGNKLGDLRFYSSYRRYREMLVVPLTRDDYVDYDWSMKLTSDITPNMKLLVSGLAGKQYTMQHNWSYDYVRTPEFIASIMEDRSGLLFGTGNFNLTDISHQSFAAKLTHTMNARTFYEVSLEHFRRDYWTRPPAARSTALHEVVPGYYLDESPFGYDPANKTGIVGMLFGGHNGKRRDNTDVSSTTFKADLTSQVNFSNLVKAGVEAVYNDLNFDYGIIASGSANVYDEHVQMRVFPVRGAVYAQDKLETNGFIMNAGLRLDYSNSNTEWWNVSPYDKYFFSTQFNETRVFPMVETKPQWQLSPRLGIAHPITVNSKLFFNYGHFKQIPSYQTLFQIGRSSSRVLANIGDPDLSLAKTISYELGFDRSFFNDFLLQVAAFYHDIVDQQDATTYRSIGGIRYNKTTNNSYEDIRGFELSLRKNRGAWWTFFGNYTYQVSTSGHFGRQQVYEDPSEQKKYDEATVNLYQDRPIPRPNARINLSFYTPDRYGPKFGSLYPFGGYMLNLLLDWRAGQWRTWNPRNNVSLAYNVQETDHLASVLRLSKTFQLDKFQIQAFMDVDNLFNYRRMSLSNFTGKAGDYEYYMSSLHLPESEDYDNIPGNDKVGSYRTPGVPYQPMFPRGAINFNVDTGEPGVIYYDRATRRYVEYLNNVWQDVDKGRLDKIVKDKAYIDMPNYSSFTFFNPRQFYFGLRVSMDLD